LLPLENRAYIEEDEKVIKLSALGTVVEAHPTGVQEYAYKPYPKEIIWHVQRARLLW
jgi:hypothetical protein